MTFQMTAHDQFCGAGGTSLAATLLGIEIVMALNHWDVAVASHSANFPRVAHECTDISACDPRRYPPAIMLLTSPECVNHTKAKGVKRQVAKQGYGSWARPVIDPAAERSRATMFDVVRFAEHFSYELILVENVIDVTDWILFDEWLMMMHKLGYRHEVICFNSMFALEPVPQSRDRAYIAFWKKGNRTPNLKFTPPAYCSKCDREVQAVQVWKNGNKYGTYGKMGQYLYHCPHCVTREVVPFHHAASTVIDWQLPIERIGDRKIPLVEKTIARVEVGRKLFGDTPFLVEYYGNSTAQALNVPLGTIPTVEKHGLCIPAPQLEDCRYRMLQLAEIGKAMAFPPHYILKGTAKERHKQYGNAITPPTVKMILQRLIASIA